MSYSYNMSSSTPEASFAADVLPLYTKINTRNGDVLIFEPGARVTPDSIVGQGVRYPLDLKQWPVLVSEVARADVTAVTTLDKRLKPGETFITTALVVAIIITVVEYWDWVAFIASGL